MPFPQEKYRADVQAEDVTPAAAYLLPSAHSQQRKAAPAVPAEVIAGAHTFPDRIWLLAAPSAHG